ncbi:MAG: PEP-CTERM sorting domain-containing protein [Desulfobacterales bacterium]|nr:PEP-CTERM sorting domain-containing protein [Desulfobacterales bacterium]
MFKILKIFLLLSTACFLFGVPNSVLALTILPETNGDLSFYDPYGSPYPIYHEYGDFYTYSLPFLAIDFDLANGGGTGPGNPYYVTSTPGAIKDDIVLYTGSSGTGVMTNPDGMDNAYPSPNSKKTPFFSTPSTDDPGGPGEFSGDVGTSWDTSLTAMTNYLNGNQLIFFFNNNEVNAESGESQILQSWGKVEIVDATDSVLDAYYFYASPTQIHGLPAPEDSDTHLPPDLSVPPDEFYVISPGGLEVDYDGDGEVDENINHNLGANQAAFAITSPELNAYLAIWDGTDDAVAMQTTFYLGEPNDQILLGLSNGFEQLFIRSGTSIQIIPEPTSLLLLGFGILGAGLATRRKALKKKKED